MTLNIDNLIQSGLTAAESVGVAYADKALGTNTPSTASTTTAPANYPINSTNTTSAGNPSILSNPMTWAVVGGGLLLIVLVVVLSRKK